MCACVLQPAVLPLRRPAPLTDPAMHGNWAAAPGLGHTRDAAYMRPHTSRWVAACREYDALALRTRVPGETAMAVNHVDKHRAKQKGLEIQFNPKEHK